jgi:hypothetical protein
LDQTIDVRHIAIDMQRLVAEKMAWHSPTVLTILPNVVRLSAALRERSLYARFTVPHNVGEAHGSWKALYRRWPMVTGQALEPALLDLVAPLADLAGPDHLRQARLFDLFRSSA